MNQISDENLIRQYQQGDRTALKTLYQRYYQYVYSVLIVKGVPALEAEDFTQDIFLRMVNALLHFSGDSTFLTYLQRSITHRLIDFYRKRRTRELQSSRAFVDLHEGEVSSARPLGVLACASGIETAELDEAVRNCLARETNASCRVVLALWLDGFKLRQIAHVLSLPPGTVNSHLARGRARLRRCLEKQYVT